MGNELDSHPRSTGFSLPLALKHFPALVNVAATRLASEERGRSPVLDRSVAQPGGARRPGEMERGQLWLEASSHWGPPSDGSQMQLWPHLRDVCEGPDGPCGRRWPASPRAWEPGNDFAREEAALLLSVFIEARWLLFNIPTHVSVCLVNRSHCESQAQALSPLSKANTLKAYGPPKSLLEIQENKQTTTKSLGYLSQRPTPPPGWLQTSWPPGRCTAGHRGQGGWGPAAGMRLQPRS